jgi:hypothetical protein
MIRRNLERLEIEVLGSIELAELSEAVAEKAQRIRLPRRPARGGSRSEGERRT